MGKRGRTWRRSAGSGRPSTPPGAGRRKGRQWHRLPPAPGPASGSDPPPGRPPSRRERGRPPGRGCAVQRPASGTHRGPMTPGRPPGRGAVTSMRCCATRPGFAMTRAPCRLLPPPGHLPPGQRVGPAALRLWHQPRRAAHPPAPLTLLSVRPRKGPRVLALPAAGPRPAAMMTLGSKPSPGTSASRRWEQAQQPAATGTPTLGRCRRPWHARPGTEHLRSSG